MFTVVVYHKLSRKIIAVLPFAFDKSVRITMSDGLLYNDFGFKIYSDMEPVLFEDNNGDICLKENAFYINSDQLTK